VLLPPHAPFPSDPSSLISVEVVTIWYPEPVIPVNFCFRSVELFILSALIRKPRRKVGITPVNPAKSLARFDPFGVSSNGASKDQRAGPASADGA
jgi:hypothetical protein